jgi:2-dehydro-3-deoxyphosphogalactonate aldolase
MTGATVRSLHPPLIPILRGITPDEVLGVADVLLDCGFGVIEVPLNSPQAEESVRRLARHVGPGVVVGAGTVLEAAQVERVADAGATLVLAPNLDAEVVRAALARGLQVMPGVATPTEAFAALRLGVALLKLFPADVLGPASVRAWRAVLPSGVALFAVGGVDEANLAAFRHAGVDGAGLGSALYRPGMVPERLRERARVLLAAWQGAGAHADG